MLQFDREPDPKWFLLRGPHRLVIDLPQTAFVVEPKSLKARGLVSNVRYGALNEGTSRLILTAKGPFAVDKVDVIANENGKGFRLVADISASSDRKFDQALADQAQTTGSTVSTKKGDRVVKPATDPGKRFTVVIDPGHGGIDGGAEGRNGTVEKTITLAFALELRNKLAKTGKYDVYLTRDTDEFLRLDERVRIARQHEADLFISIHADTISRKGIRGATVYTVSDKASDAEAEATADRENLSDTLAGIDIKEENHEVADILVDLIRRETHTFSVRFARSLVGELSPTDRTDQQSASLGRLQGAARRPTCRPCWSNSAICPTPRTRSSCATPTGATRRPTASPRRSRCSPAPRPAPAASARPMSATGTL